MNAVIQRHRGVVVLTVPMKTKNPLNANTGNTRLAGIIRTRAKAKQRETVALHLRAKGDLPSLPVDVTITRIAPSRGLDPHDGLGAALKGTIDEVAKALGVDDRDDRVRWRLDQRRGPYAVEIRISARET